MIRSSLFVLAFLLFFLLLVQAETIRYEAEDGELVGTLIKKSVSGYSGTGYVSGFNETDDRVEVSVDVNEAGFYQVVVGYRSASGDKTEYFTVNGETQAQLKLTQSKTFREAPPLLLWLGVGLQRLGIRKYWGWAEIDYFDISQKVLPELDVPKTLVDANALPCVQNLFDYLVDQYGHGIIAGQQSIDQFPWILEHIGEQPALAGFDMINYSPSRVERSAKSTAVEDAIQWAAKGGIVQFQWHWNAPKDLIDQPDKEWWRGFYTYATTFDLAHALSNRRSEDYQLLLRDMDVIAEQLKRLQDANVPVLWRPLHEAEGGWFWWGAKGAGPCLRLYDLMYERFTELHGLHNLIWIWTTSDSEDAWAWYPGHDRVDVLGVDIYAPPYNASAYTPTFYRVVDIFEGKKLVTLSENGVIPDPDQLVREKAAWSWFMTWSDFVSNGEHNTLEQVQHAYAHEYVITHRDLPFLPDASDVD